MEKLNAKAAKMAENQKPLPAHNAKLWNWLKISELCIRISRLYLVNQVQTHRGLDTYCFNFRSVYFNFYTESGFGDIPVVWVDI